jgi:hypothetical protein
VDLFTFTDMLSGNASCAATPDHLHAYTAAEARRLFDRSRQWMRNTPQLSRGDARGRSVDFASVAATRTGVVGATSERRSHFGYEDPLR